MRVDTSRTITAFRRLSGRMIGDTVPLIASCAFESAVSARFVVASRDWLLRPPAISSCRMEATPRICAPDSGSLERKLTLSAHVLTSGKMRVSISLKVRSCLRRSAFSIVVSTSCT